MSGLLHRLGVFCVRHRYPILALWLVAAVVLIVLAGRSGSNTHNNLYLPGTNSQEASDLLDERFPSEANFTTPIVLAASSGKLTDQKNEAAIQQTVAALQRDSLVREAVSPLGPEGANALSKNEKIGYIPLTLTVGQDKLTDEEAESILKLADPARAAGLQVAGGGYLGEQVSQPSTDDSVAVGLVAAMIVLFIAFGSIVAMGMPIVTALVGLGGALSIIALLANITEIPNVAPTLATMIGLGVGIDYSLFIVSRHRAQLNRGMRVTESIPEAIATSGKAVVFAGATVVIALCSLALARISIVTTLGYTAGIAVAIAVLAALTLLPALLAIVGERINSLRLPTGRRALRHPHKPPGWARWARSVANHPWRAITIALGVLILLALPALSLRLGQRDDGQLQKSTTARQAY
ncbi:hypothetical protein LCGC14_1789020, partial [marine sediment metagenome]